MDTCRKERKKEEHEGCFQGTLFVQGTTKKTLVIKGALVERDNGRQSGKKEECTQ